ncbi:MAG: N-acyl homoserine lactonase family protein [Deltaproteobacteria bacterium]|nr:N-acyl homoserine lactonase family protein [Deltaproteobacteria bacterium]
MPKTKVCLLDGGSLVLDGFHIYWNRGPGGEVRFPCYSVLIDHPEGRFLFDTGFDFDHVQRVLPFEKPIQTGAQTLPGALSLLGLKTEDIDCVINSHYHFDHCGGNKHLLNTRTICHSLEFESLKNPLPFEGLGYSDLSFVPEIARVQADPEKTQPQNLDLLPPNFELIGGDTQIVKGLWVFETPGHTAGHCSLMVELGDRRPMLFTADACYGQKSLDLMCISSFHVNPTASLDSMQRLKDLAAEYDAELFFSHEDESYAGYLKAPDCYF